MSKTQPARGTRDFLPADVRKRDYVIGIIKEVYQSYGFEPLETPAVENLETLTGKYGEEGNQLMFKILKRGEKLQEELNEGKITSPNQLSDLALRYDLTVPLARVVANNKNELPKFFKRYQIQPVWRADRPARGRYREFYQCDVDAIGSKSMLVEAELCAAVSEILTRLGFDDFVIRVNHRELLVRILEAAGVSEDKYIDALIALDKLDKIGREGVTRDFFQRGVNLDSTEKLLIFFQSIIDSDIRNTLGKSPTNKLIELQRRLFDIENNVSNFKSNVINGLYDVSERIKTKLNLIENDSLEKDSLLDDTNELVEITKQYEPLIYMYGNILTLELLVEFLMRSSQDKDIQSSNAESVGLSELLKLVKSSQSTYAANKIIIDLTLARGLSYYTGAIFEINVPDLAGSLGGGGRYDGLIGMFGKEEIPACGFSLGLERILVVMEERGMFPAELNTNAADVLVTVWNEETAGESLTLASELRKENLRVTVYPEADKLGKQFKYADAINSPFVCVLGESELAENTVTLKNLRTGAQETVAREAVAAKIKAV